MIVNTILPHHTTVLDTYSYRMQRCPNSALVLLNDELVGVKLVDPWSGVVRWREAYPPSYTPLGGTDMWCLAQDGTQLVAFFEGDGEDPTSTDRFAAWFAVHSEQPAQEIPFPPIRRLHNLIYIWDDELILASDRVPPFYALRGINGDWQFIQLHIIYTRQHYGDWRTATAFLGRTGRNIQHIDQEKQFFLYSEGWQKGVRRVGYLHWPTQVQWSVQTDLPWRGLASDGQQMFVAVKEAVHALTPDGTTAAIYAIPEGYRVYDLDVLPATATDPAALVVLAQTLASPVQTKLLLYHLNR